MKILDSRASFVIAVLLALGLTSVARAQDVKLTYVGTFKALSGYYEAGLTFVPAGSNADRPGGTQVDFPTLLTVGCGHDSNDPVKEWRIPADAILAKTPTDTLPSAVQVTPWDGTSGEGGTYLQGDGDSGTFEFSPDNRGIGSGMTLLNGRAYINRGGNTTMHISGELKLGYWLEGAGHFASDYVFQYPGQLPSVGYYTASRGGLATKTDQADTLIYVMYDLYHSTYSVAVNTTVKGAPDPATPGKYIWATTNQFIFPRQDADRAWPIIFVEIGGKGYYVMYNSIVGHKNGATLDFYDSSVFRNDGSGAADASGGPSFSLDINAAMEGAWGWNDDDTTMTTYIQDFAYDPDTSRLYVIETNRSGCRSGTTTAPIHVFELAPAVQPQTGTVIVVK